MHRALRILSTALITAGVVILADVGLTLADKEPLSSLYGSIQQGKAEGQLEDLERSFPTAGDLGAAAGADDLSERVAILADRFARAAEKRKGLGIGRISIPAIGVDQVIVEGTDTASLRKGPGHFSPSDDEATRKNGDGSAFPGMGETVGIAGHRTTYGAPFHDLDKLKSGDKITVEMPYATFTYVVQKNEIVNPDEIGVVQNVGEERLVLSACHPLYSAAQRIITFAKLDEISLFGSGGGLWQDP